MNASLILPASRSFSSPLARLLATTALTTILLATPSKSAQAQVVIGDQPPPTQQEYQQRPITLPERGDWPYNVKLPRKPHAALDPETLPSRQVSPKLMQAAHLMQSGLSPSQVQEAMAQPAPIMAAPELQGDKPDAPRDDTTTLPPVATGPLMASLADNGIGEAPATVAIPTEVAANNTAVLTPPAAPASDSVMPSSMAMLGETPAAAPAPSLASQLEAPKPNTGRALFGGKRVQVADATPMDKASASESSASVDNGNHTLKAPGNTSASQAAPAQDIATAATPSVDAPADTARNSTPAKMAPLTSLSAPPKLLARIGDSSHGAVQRPADRTVAAEPTPDAAPVEPVAPEAPRAPEPQPTPAPAAVLPAKADDTAQAALVPMPQPQSGDDDNASPAPVITAAAPAPVAAAKPPEHKTFWNRMFGSSEDHPEAKPAPLPPVEPAKPLASATPESAPVLVATTPVAVASPVVVAADAQPEPTLVPTSEPVAAQAPVATHTLVAPQSAEPTPEPIKEAAPAPLPQAEIAERPQTTAPSPESAIEPVEPIASAAPVAKKPVAKAERRTLWGDLFGYDDKKPAAAAAAAEPAAGPTADEEPYEPIPTAGFAAPTVVNEPATLSRSKPMAKANTDAVLPKPEDRPLEPAAEPMPTTAPASAIAPAPIMAPAPAPLAPLSDAEPPTRYIEVAPEQAPTYVPAASVIVAPVPMIMAPAAPVVPAFRVEAPTAPSANGLVTPRLVPIAPAGAAAPAAMRGSNSATISVPSGAPLAQVNFLPSSQNVDSVGQAQLQAIAEAMQMGPQTRLLLNAYAKASNEPESRRISLNRALMVRTKLAELGIQPSRIDVQALGEDTPSGIDGGHDRVDAILH